MIYKLELEVGSKTKRPEDFLELVEKIKKSVQRQGFQLNYAVPRERAMRGVYLDKWVPVKRD